MPKNKRPAPRKSKQVPEEDEEVMALALAELALDIAEREDDDADSLRQKMVELNQLVRNALRKKKDEALYGAIEIARYSDPGALQVMRSSVENAAATLTIRRDDAPAQEINAFLVPLFVHGTGGLKQEETFQDDQAFEQLRASFQRFGLESPDATVVLISHAYDLAEIDSISYSRLGEILREVAATMNEKKLVATPALSASIAGWSGGGYDPADETLELRFLLGFARTRADDPYNLPPADEAGVDAYFSARLKRYQDWTQQVAPLVAACLSRDPDSLSINFLYQDLFYGAKEEAMAEAAMLGMLAEIQQVLEENGIEPGQASAVVGLAATDEDLVLRANVYRNGTLLAETEKPFDVAADPQVAIDDLCDALGGIGIEAISVAGRFRADGQPEDVRAWTAE